MSGSEKNAKRARGRPPGFDRSSALDKAVTVFWTRGYDGASVDDLTDAMGLNRSSLYQAFGDKRALFFAALDRYGATAGGAPMEALRQASGPFATTIRAFIETAILGQTRPEGPRGCLVTCVLSDTAGVDPEARERLAMIVRATDGEIAARARAAVARGELPPDTRPETLAIQVSNLMQGLSIRARAGIEADTLRREAAAVLDQLVPAR